MATAVTNNEFRPKVLNVGHVPEKLLFLAYNIRLVGFNY